MLYIVLFPEGGRRFLIPPHGDCSRFRYLRADDPAAVVREPWPSRERLQEAAQAVAEGMDRKRRRAA